mmetsp:Transcript_18696/g.32462  ORF Transcript_18696/g.32462 Transcript_18696/m.32462 type:complete len:132 (-) Transcript_18696:220-615(-)
MAEAASSGMASFAPLSQSVRLELTQARNDVQDLYTRIAALESEKSEHEMVMEQIKDLPKDRKCWHQVGNVLSEQTVEQVVQILETNLEQIKNTLTKMSSEVQQKEQKLGEIMSKHGIMETKEGGIGPAKAS